MGRTGGDMISQTEIEIEQAKIEAEQAERRKLDYRSYLAGAMAHSRLMPRRSPSLAEIKEAFDNEVRGRSFAEALHSHQASGR